MSIICELESGREFAYGSITWKQDPFYWEWAVFRF